MNKVWLTFLFLSTLLFSTNAAPPRKKVCIVGAGPAGIVTVKNFAEHLDEFEPIAFEKNLDVGGLWIYDESTTVDQHGLPIHSSVYKYLRTSQPKELMSCPKYPEFEGEDRSCVTHETVVEYMKNYTEHFNLRRFIKFETNVEKVTVVPGEKEQHTYWDVQTKDLITNETETTRCYSVIVCTGQFHTPSYPNVTGIENYQGRKMHSHTYRKPEDFANLTVLVVGANFAGSEIAVELSPYVKTLYLSHSKKLKSDMPSNVVHVPRLTAADSQDLIFEDGSKLRVDFVIFCTGYQNDMPFLDESSGVKVMPKSIYPLYNQVINVNYTSMGFIGLVVGLNAFCPKFYAQVNYYMSFLQNKFELPEKDVMLKDAQRFLPENMRGVKPEWYWDTYVNQLVYSGGFPALPAYYSQGLTKWAKFRECNIPHFKEYDLRVDDNCSPKIINPNSTQQAVELDTVCKS